MQRPNWACHLIEEGRSVREIAKIFNIHTATIYRTLGSIKPDTAD